MIKKVLIPMILLGACGVAENEVGINVGVVSINNDDGSQFDNFQYGATYMLNNIDSQVKPRIDLDILNISKESDPVVGSTVKVSINGVYKYKDSTSVQGHDVRPYLVGGIGYEYVNDSKDDYFESLPFVQLGGGISVDIGKKSKLNVEAKILQVIGGEEQNNEIIITTGMDFSLEDANECPVKISAPDSDRDGIADSIDQCSNTPCGFSVDRYGCAVKATLKIYFDVNAYTIKEESLEKVRNFANYMLRDTDTYVTIEGHTDSDGSDSYNYILSENRAKSVVNQLEQFGVSPARLDYIGYGEGRPIATNGTAYGKALNRRIIARIKRINRTGEIK